MRLNQKLGIATTVAISLYVLEAAPAKAVTLNFDWTGNAGYSAKGSFVYDEIPDYSTIDISKL
ncbi:hypothetical protein A6770_25325 [Nostoc minutum NIES-26]|uniref:PEP-CTERM sorting domain-containing protein n=1 Tax=Nostoc minutum NIES-26 TaxID=1844469 RepID=A0A367QTY9_9NOSO|nr:hypothetical protein A6770_25325 [Nostoc minutum NIES-26]